LQWDWRIPPAAGDPTVRLQERSNGGKLLYAAIAPIQYIDIVVPVRSHVDGIAQEFLRKSAELEEPVKLHRLPGPAGHMLWSDFLCAGEPWVGRNREFHAGLILAGSTEESEDHAERNNAGKEKEEVSFAFHENQFR
jgi:hypothetical protein